jgi:hypothetical protein
VTLWLSDAELIDATRRKQTMTNDTMPEDWLRPSQAELAVMRRAWQSATPLEWGGMLLRPGRKRYPRDGTHEADAMPGIYSLSMADGGIVYVGKSSNLSSRLNDHFYASRMGRAEWFDFFTFMYLPDFAVRDVEVAHIHAMRPERNALYEPVRWAGHPAMVTALRTIWRIAC